MPPLCHRSFDETVTLLNWNVQKKNLRPRFRDYLERLVAESDIDILTLQEAAVDGSTGHRPVDYHGEFAPNIRLFHRMFGVLTAARRRHETSLPILSSHREGLLSTRKSALLTTYPLADGHLLTVANIHAINFRSAEIYLREIATLTAALSHCRGPMIVAGDFNTWNARRMEALMQMCRRLGLVPALMSQPHLIRSFMRHRLDHIFYRGLTLLESRVIEADGHSDHNPLYARFGL